MRRSALTLVEILVVIAIVAVLTGILLFAIGPSLEAARRAKSATNVRTLLAAFEAWAESHDGRYPSVVAGRPYPYGCSGVLISYAPVWQGDVQWPWVICDTLCWRESYDVFVAPGSGRSVSDPDFGFPTSYLYSHSFFARPEVWSGKARADPSLLGPVARHEVAFPSQKAMLWDWEAPYIPGFEAGTSEDLPIPTPVGFPDGHVALLRPTDATGPVQNPFLPATPPRPLHDTPMGVRGLDYP